ncbi:MAG: ATP-dependent DNA helicase RecG [Candidatus Dormibacteria bacterium]
MSSSAMHDEIGYGRYTVILIQGKCMRVREERMTTKATMTNDVDMLSLDLLHIPGIGRESALRLQRLGLFTVRDLLLYLPRRYDDTRERATLSSLTYGSVNTVSVQIRSVATRESPRRRMVLTVAELEDETGVAEAIWFNQRYIERQLHQGEKYVVSGKVERSKGTAVFRNPQFEHESDTQHHVGRITPIYPETEGISSKFLRTKIGQLRTWIPSLPDVLPERIRQERALLDLSDALRRVHFPESFAEIEEARRRLAFEELFCIGLVVEQARRRRLQESSIVIPYDVEFARERVSHLPFHLTDGQRIVTHEIFQDLAKPYAMNRLLQGDVGSGKTVVAMLAASMTCHAGHQVAFMAPTELLARQHHTTLIMLLESEDIPVRLLVGSMTEAAKREVAEFVATGIPAIIVGTHALLEERIQPSRLGLVIIDEQHRFGVEQRQSLRQKGVLPPNFLAMTATPIPRSLALTKYGDLDLSVLTERPAKRGKVVTEVIHGSAHEAAFLAARAQLELGHQVFVICPIIEESEDLDGVMSVTTEMERLSQGAFAQYRLGILHGRLSGKEKDDVMEQFRAHNLDVLVTTSVVEVGVDVPNATVMIIESADRFGLAQLHQFRGRVGRGSATSYCYLMQESADELATQRLQAVASTESGFLLAEQDLKLRGHGEIGGLRQHGDSMFRIADLLDAALLHEAQEAASLWLDTDPNLEQYAPLHEAMKAYQYVLDLD